MGSPIFNKILARAGKKSSVAAGDLIMVDVDMVVLYDSNFFPVYWRDPIKVANPDRITVIFDHRVPAPDRGCAQAQISGREFAKRFGIRRLHDVGYDQGIAHTVVADKGYAVPGGVLVCSDYSHRRGRRVQLRCARRRRPRYHLRRHYRPNLVCRL